MCGAAEMGGARAWRGACVGESAHGAAREGEYVVGVVPSQAHRWHGNVCVRVCECVCTRASAMWARVSPRTTAIDGLRNTVVRTTTYRTRIRYSSALLGGAPLAMRRAISASDMPPVREE